MNRRWAGTAVYAGILLCIVLYCQYTSANAIRFAEKASLERTALVLSGLKEPAAKEQALLALKQKDSEKIAAGKSLLIRYGYEGAGDEFLEKGERRSFMIQNALFGVLFAGGISLLILLWKQRNQRRIAGLTEYLSQMNTGTYLIQPSSREDAYSGLEDELYKTVVLLRESREKASRERENLAKNLADISHQLKTPLTTVSLLSELLSFRVQGEREQQYIQQILAQAERLNGLVAMLLTLSRLDAGTLSLTPRRVNVQELVSCAAEPLVPQMEARGQRFAVSGEESISLLLDFRWSAEALGNLIKNCSEHTKKGGKISVQYSQNPIYTQICIEDEGTGFDPEELPHVFERFYRGKNSAEESTGIGLSLAQSLIRRQNGELCAENRKEGGARFVAKFYHVISPD